MLLAQCLRKILVTSGLRFSLAKMLKKIKPKRLLQNPPKSSPAEHVIRERCDFLNPCGGVLQEPHVFLVSSLSVLCLAQRPPPLPDARPRSERFRCGGRESKFLAATAHDSAREPVTTRNDASRLSCARHHFRYTGKRPR